MKQPLELVLVVLTLLAYGCPIPALVAAFGLDERTIAAWQLKAGQHVKRVWQQVVCQGSVDLSQVQADELYTKTQAVLSDGFWPCRGPKSLCSSLSLVEGAIQHCP